MDKNYLRDSARDSKSIWRLYHSRRKKQNNKNLIYCFFEGDDDPKYYNSRVENILEREISHFICNGKKGVLDTLKDFNMKKDINNNTMFFIDSDFDKFLNISHKHKNLYVTSCYSIENYFTDIEVFKKILKIEFKINEDNENYIKYINLYEEFQEEFHKYMLEINGLILLYQYLKKETNYNKTINYQNINVNLRTDLENDKIKNKIFDELIKKRENNQEIDNIFDNFKNSLNINPKCNFRGKFEIMFLNKFLVKLQHILNDKIKKDNEKKDKKNKIKKISFNFNEKNIISNLSQYALNDEKLRIFLKNIIN